MKKCHVFLSLFFVFFACSGLAIAAVPDPVASYDFNEGSGTTVLDSSGYGNHGTIYGAEYVQLSADNYALDFRNTGEGGTGDQVVYGDIEQFADLQDDFSISAIVNIRSSMGGNTSGIVSQDGIGRFIGLHGYWTFYGYNGSRFIEVLNPSPTVFNTWYHVVLVHDGNHDESLENDLIIYINGFEVARSEGGNYLSNTSRIPWQTGKGSDWIVYGEEVHWLDGTVDEVKIWNVALTAAEVDELVNGAPEPLEEDTPPETCLEALAKGYNIKADLNKDCHVDLLDFAMMAQDWLTCNDPGDVSCIVTW